MTFGLLALLAATIAATWWAKHLARHRQRRVAAWAFATAMLPPLVLVLWALPAKPAA